MIFGNAEVLVIKSKRKTISIQIKPNEVIVRAPTKMKQSEIEEFVESKRNWIEKHLQYFIKNLPNALTLWKTSAIIIHCIIIACPMVSSR